MRALTRFGRDLRRLAAMLMLAVALAGCTHVQLAAPYDAATDTELGSVLQDTTSFVAKMVTNAGQPAGAYAQNTDFYDNMEGRLALLVARAQANRVLDNCPSTQAMARALAAADLWSSCISTTSQSPRGDCDVVLMQLLQQQFHDLRAFHQAEGALGIPAAAVGPLLDGGLGATLRAAMAVQRAKQVNR